MLVMDQIKDVLNHLAANGAISRHSYSTNREGIITDLELGGALLPVERVLLALRVLAGEPVSPAKMTVTVDQIQSMALKTLGFRGEHGVRLEYDNELGIVSFDIYHVRIEIEDDGSWRAFAKESGETLSTGRVPDFRQNRQVV